MYRVSSWCQVLLLVQKSEHERLPELTFWGQENQIHEEVSMMSGSNESLEEYTGELEETDKVGVVRALRKDAGKSKGKIPETRMCFRKKKKRMCFRNSKAVSVAGEGEGEKKEKVSSERGDFCF